MKSINNRYQISGS